MSQQDFPALNAQLVKEHWSKTYNREGKPDWSHIFPFYAENILFQDSIQRVEGLDSFTEMCERLTKRCESLYMELHHVVQNQDVIFFEWTMTMAFRKWPSTHLYGSTRLTLNNEGRIIEQRDYYDLWGDIFNNIPRFKKLYRSWIRKYFG
jgi:hypothetical protein